jgi:hypothetical protein
MASREDLIHAVARARDEADVCCGVEGREFVWVDGGVEELHRDVVYFACADLLDLWCLGGWGKWTRRGTYRICH